MLRFCLLLSPGCLRSAVGARLVILQSPLPRHSSCTRRCAVCRSLVPRGAHRYATLIPPAAESRASKVSIADYVRARLLAMASQGMAGVVVWNDGTVADAEGDETRFGRAV